MPEEQNVRGDLWNKQVNSFLTKVLGWNQLGTSNVDVFCEKINQNVGLDSVFAYRTREEAAQQVVFVEAKRREDMSNVNRAELQKWIQRLLTKVEIVPASREFLSKFQPSSDAQFHIGLLAIWIQNTATFDAAVLQQRLTQVELPSRRTPQYIFVLDNQRLLRLAAMYSEVEQLRASPQYGSIDFHIPSNRSSLICNRSVLPIETLHSDLIILRANKTQELRGSNHSHTYKSALMFYFGDVRNSGDLHFIDLAIRDLGLEDTTDIDVYLLSSLESIRSEIEAHTRNSPFSISFKRLVVADELPGWLTDHD